MKNSQKTSLLVETRLTGSAAEVILIESGWSMNGRYYSEQVLRDSISLFENKPISIYGFGAEADHLDQGFRDFTPGFASNIAGWAVNVREGKGPKGNFALIADFKIARDDVKNLLATASELKSGFPLGLSIDAQGIASRGMAEGKTGLLVNQIEHVFEITLVDRPAAGGKILRLTASEEKKEGEKSMELKAFLTSVSGRLGLDPGEIENLDDAQLIQKIIEALSGTDGDPLVKLAIQFFKDGKIDEAISALQLWIDAPETAEDPTEVFESIKRELSQAKLSRLLAESKLSSKAQAKIRKRFTGKIASEREILEAIDDTRDLLTESAPKAGLIQPSVSIVHDKRDKLAQSLDLIFGYQPSKDESLTESTRSQYKSLGRPRSIKAIAQEYTALCEATTNDMPNHLGDSINRKLKQDYAVNPSYFDELISVSQVGDWKTQEIMAWGGFNFFPTVAEGAAYQDLGFPREEKSTFRAEKHGGTVNITREMIDNDDLGILQQIPVRLARAARHSLNLFKGGFVTARLANGTLGAINSATTYDGKVVYHADHFNAGTDALSYANLNTALDRLDNQRDFGISAKLTIATTDNTTTSLTLNSNLGIQVGDDLQIEAEIVKVATVNNNGTGITVVRGAYGTTAKVTPYTINTPIYQLTQPIPVAKKYLYVPNQLRGTASNILTQQQIPGDPNSNTLIGLVSSGELGLVNVPAVYLGGDTNNWYLGADKSAVETGRLAFKDGREDPEIFFQDNPLVGDVFSREVYTYKIRHEYGGVITDWRGVYGSIVSG